MKIWPLIVVFLFSGKAFAHTNPDSISSNIFDIEKNSALQRIQFEKVRIVNDYKSADSRFINLTDSVTQYILNLDVPLAKRNMYLERLQVFLRNIDRYYSESYLKNGTYLAILSYYPVIMDWDKRDDLLSNLEKYTAFSVKSARLIPNDTIAEDFLFDYMKDHQDDVFRYVEEFDDRRFALKLLEKATHIAPESAKRYYTSANPVRDILSSSNDPFVKKSFEIYAKFGLRSHAYLLLDRIMKGEMTIDQADSIARDQDVLFSMLIDLSSQYEANFTYSMYRFTQNYSIEAMRKIAQQAVNPNYTFDGFKSLTKEEMFVLLAYGYKEVRTATFQTMMDILLKKANNSPVNGVVVNSVNRDALKQLVLHCDKNKELDDLLGVLDDERRSHLLVLANSEDREDVMPPFKSFTNNNINTSLESYRTISEITKARPPRNVSIDTINDEPAYKPEKPSQSPVASKPVEQKSTAQQSEKLLAMAIPPVKEKLAVAGEVKMDVTPIPPPEPVEPIKIDIDPRSRTILTLKKNILKSLSDIPSFIDKDYAEEVLMYAAEKEPDELFKRIDDFKGKFFCKKILEECAVNAPVSVKRYLFNPRQPVNYILQYSNNPVVKKIFEINQQLTYQSKPMLLLDDIVNNRITVSEAVSISSNTDDLFDALVKIISRPDYLGRYSIDHEMRDYSLRFVRDINDKIASGAPQPFYAIENFSAPQLYFLMLYGRDEVFTSTFNGMFNRFMQKLPADDGAVFFTSVNYNHFRDFLSLCSNYGVLEEFLAKFDPDVKQQLLEKYIAHLEDEKDNLSSVVLIAEAISNLTDYKVLTALEGAIKNEYGRVTKANDKIGISIYGVLSSIISGNAQIDADWYRHIAQEFKISPVSTLVTSTLFNKGGVCVEQMYFYNDEDGRSSFINFMHTYKNQPYWNIEDKSSYVRISSTDGTKVEIYANKPEQEQNGIDAIANYMQEKNYSPTVIVHRGHSFHTEATLEKVTGSARLIFVGSCGGFYKISIALANAPEAHIISTKQVGTKTVNDAVLYALNENVRQGKDIVWNEFWDKMRTQLVNNQYFSDYIPPHKNLEATFIRAYYKILGV